MPRVSRWQDPEQIRGHRSIRLRFPHTFYVVAALIVFLGGVAIRTMPADILPEINIPVVTVIWSYTGLSTPEMEQRVTTYSQYSICANVAHAEVAKVERLLNARPRWGMSWQPSCTHEFRRRIKPLITSLLTPRRRVSPLTR